MAWPVDPQGYHYGATFLTLPSRDLAKIAPGSQSYVDGLPVYFLVRADEYTKETFGGVAPECGRSVNNISGCSP